jgi:hypothetical protein
MKKLTNLIKTTDTKKIVGLGVATAIGVASGVKTVAKKRTQDLANSDVTKKAAEKLQSTVAAGSKVVSGVREDIGIIVGAAKNQSCAGRCEHCAVKDTFKPCCKNGEPCKVTGEAATEETVKDETPEPVKATDVSALHEESDLVAEAVRIAEAKADEVAAKEKKVTPRKPRTPRVAKANAKPVSVKEDTEDTTVEEAPVEKPEEK